MIIDFKYHITTIVAVFMALGIGIVIGSLIVGESFVTTVVNEQENIVQKLEGEYRNLKYEAKLQQDEIKLLQKNNEYYQEYLAGMLPKLIEGRLNSAKIAVIGSGDVQIPEYLLNNLKLTGAELLVQDKMPDITSLDESVYELAQKLDAVLYISIDTSEQKNISAVQAFVNQSFTEKKPMICNIIVGPDQSADFASEEEENVYYIDSADCVCEQVSLILNIAENRKSQVFRETLELRQ